MDTENYFRSYSYSQARWFAACITSSGHNAVCIAPPVQPVVDRSRLAPGLSSDLVLHAFNPPTPSTAAIDNAVQPGDVVEVVIPRLPQPDELTPWDKILEFKNDPETKALLLSLRAWIHRSTSTAASLQEIAAELDALTQGCHSECGKRKSPCYWRNGTLQVGRFLISLSQNGAFQEIRISEHLQLSEKLKSNVGPGVLPLLRWHDHRGEEVCPTRSVPFPTDE